MYKLLALIALFFALPVFAQSTAVTSSGLPSPNLVGWGNPGNTYTCNSDTANLTFLQLDAGTAGFAPGFIWICAPPTPGGTLSWRHLTLPQVTDSSGNFLNETCVHAKVNSTALGAWSVTYPSIGSTVTSINATSVSAAGTIAGSSEATVTSATTTAAAGAVMTFGTLNVLGVNVTIPLLSTAVTPVYVQICATP